ncbi:MAG: plastocyanin/azurin family copper-binding protein, partial [Planctomycetota bacterium]|nr:plastocyanin/azurin family copper-binding protein [Planctomycetota bacterium]
MPFITTTTQRIPLPLPLPLGEGRGEGRTARLRGTVAICASTIISYLLLLPLFLSPTCAEQTIEIRAVSGLRFEPPRFQVKPGEKISLTFNNVDQMMHNFVIVRRGAKDRVVNAAMQMGAEGPAKNYIPESPDVLWNTKTLNPQMQEALSFTAPSEEGVYPYVCSFPGHGYQMFGAMYVTNGKLPPIEKDSNVPAS